MQVFKHIVEGTLQQAPLETLSEFSSCFHLWAVSPYEESDTLRNWTGQGGPLFLSRSTKAEWPIIWREKHTQRNTHTHTHTQTFTLKVMYLYSDRKGKSESIRLILVKCSW